MSAVIDSHQPERREQPERRQPTSASRIPWTATMNGNFAVIADRDKMPVANVHVFEGSAAHGRLTANVELIVKACSAHYDLVALAKSILPQLKAAAESDARAGIHQSENIRRFHLARNGLVSAGVKA